MQKDLHDWKADIIFELNAENVMVEYFGQFDLVVDGGTLEYVFHQFNALNNINSLVFTGYYICHILPSAGGGNHSFFNYSPIFFTDIYNVKNGWLLDKLYFFSKPIYNIDKP